jgi:hypothetical protein
MKTTLQAIGISALTGIFASAGLAFDDGFTPMDPNAEIEFRGLRSVKVPVRWERPVETGFHTMAVGGAPLPIFLNRYGGTYYGGQDNSAENRSIVVGQGSAEVSAFNGSESTWTQTVSCLQDMFSRFNVVITEQEPANGAYVEAVIGGTPGEVGLPNGVGGVAPIDTYQCEIIDRAVVFAFAGNLPDDGQTLCEVAAQEIAHAFTLDHAYLCQDPMTYLNGCGAKSFQDIDAQCGEYSPRACECNRSSQNSVQLLLEKVGASDGSVPTPPEPIDDNEPPAVSLVSPQNGATLAENTEIQVVATATDDTNLTAVELLWEYNDLTIPCPSQGNGYGCTKSGDAYTWSLNVSTGSRTFKVRVRDAVGNVVETPSRTIALGDPSNPEDPAPTEPDPDEPNDPIAPPADATPPQVVIMAPANNASAPANSTISVVVAAIDEGPLAEVELLWPYTGDAFTCPVSGNGYSCSVTGTTYTWQLSVGTGSRTFRVRATDTSGNVTETQPHTINLVEGLDPDLGVDDPLEENDDLATATPVLCGSQLNAIAALGDEDWFLLDTDAGVQVEVEAAAMGSAALEVALTSGNDAAVVYDTGTHGQTLAVVAEGSGLIAIRVNAEAAGNYLLTLACTAPTSDPDPGAEDSEDPAEVSDSDWRPGGEDPLAPPQGDGPAPTTVGGCAQTDSNASLPAALLFGFLAFRPRRRRQA